jgi:hypothetical protein
MFSVCRMVLAVFLGVVSMQALAQRAADDPDWKENDAPPAPEFDSKRLVRFDVVVGGALDFGVDPATITIGKDGVVRYVVVASSANGNLNAMYEAIRCATGEFKTYARRTGDSQWSAVQQPTWRSMQENMPSRHAFRLAKQGVCTGRAPASTVAEIVRGLTSPHSSNR